MTIVEDITWMQALAGGALIGLASSLLLFANGKIAGISGIAGGVLNAKKNDRWWRILFVLGLVIGGFITVYLNPNNTILIEVPSLYRSITAGVFVGIGTALGSGCTSGHGVCGISRFSKRSLIATATFMFFGFVTVWLGV
ncbi:MAG: YeeE/YedE family protein [Halobacteriovorax sp.]|nr:YeeE/YedE family protein [Halobacteriovorax sp.]|tara:strand:+ start:670 stop:1089 length:420 start_codon:yes stop_codon:yes gene_type:complete